MSLRARLVLIVVAITVLGLIVAAYGTAAVLRSYMIGRVDSQLRAAATFSTVRLIDPPQLNAVTPPLAPVNRPRDQITDVQAARLDTKGRVVYQLTGPFSAKTDAFTAVPSEVLARARGGTTVSFEISRHGHYRGVAERLPGTGDVAVVITSLQNLDSTLDRLNVIEAVATSSMVAAAALLALCLVSVALRPLRHMADTADAVASGEVERRAAVRGGREVSRLASALNSAFDARAASETALRRFISDASHELRTPLTSIRGYAQLLRAGAIREPADVDRAATRIEREGARMSMLVEELLALARLDESRPLALTDVDVATVAADAIDDARAVAPDAHITLSSPSSFPIRADETALRQVFSNLLGNALQHTPAGTSVEVTISRTNGVARIDVADDGPGIAAADRSHVFERFWHARRDDTTERSDGHGLGLAIVAAIAHAHGGDARLQESDCGAHFVVTLPVAAGHATGT